LLGSAGSIHLYLENVEKEHIVSDPTGPVGSQEWSAFQRRSLSDEQMTDVSDRAKAFGFAGASAVPDFGDLRRRLVAQDLDQPSVDDLLEGHVSAVLDESARGVLEGVLASDPAARKQLERLMQIQRQVQASLDLKGSAADEPRRSRSPFGIVLTIGGWAAAAAVLVLFAFNRGTGHEGAVALESRLARSESALAAARSASNSLEGEVARLQKQGADTSSALKKLADQEAQNRKLVAQRDAEIARLSSAPSASNPGAIWQALPDMVASVSGLLSLPSRGASDLSMSPSDTVVRGSAIKLWWHVQRGAKYVLELRQGDLAKTVSEDAKSPFILKASEVKAGVPFSWVLRQGNSFTSATITWLPKLKSAELDQSLAKERSLSGQIAQLLRSGLISEADTKVRAAEQMPRKRQEAHLLRRELQRVIDLARRAANGADTSQP
jgi:hypothetical protein